MPPSAILFDFDGVLADTENHHVAAWQRTLAVLGWQIADEVAARSAEIDDRDFLTQLFAERGIAGADIEGWVRRKQKIFLPLVSNEPRLYPGVKELVEELRPRARLAIVSGAWRENILAVLHSAGFAELFEVIVSKEDVAAPKPAGDGYECALERLGISASSAIALEDSPTGIAAARSAGIPVIAVGHRRPFGEWVGGAAYVSGFQPALGLLRHLGFLS
jgi:HAD superfamily hydrolase (TIGR01509 family)